MQKKKKKKKKNWRCVNSVMSILASYCPKNTKMKICVCVCCSGGKKKLCHFRFWCSVRDGLRIQLICPISKSLDAISKGVLGLASLHVGAALPAAVLTHSFKDALVGSKGSSSKFSDLKVMGSKSKIFIVLEYATGGELFNNIANHGRMGETEARKYFHQLINAIDYCHSRGVYHRDLKLENLLLDASGNLKVSDFGFSALSQQVRDDGLLHTTCGTPNYVAPEVLNDRGYDGAPADLWSCGVILFVLLAGYLPFDDHNIVNLYKRIANANFTFPSWFSFSIKQLLTRILDPNPVTRITVSEILEDGWFRKDDKPPVFDAKHETSLDDVHAAFKVSQDHYVTGREEQPAALNAFELIGLSKGLNLGGLFTIEQEFKRETRFTSTCSADEIIRKIEEATKPLGYDIHKKNYKMMLRNVKAGRKGNLNVLTEIFQVAPSLHMVEVRKDKGDTLEFQKFYKTLSTSLKDVIWISEEDLQAQAPKL